MEFLSRISSRHIWVTGIAIHILAAWFSAGYFHADEHFQLLEYASYKLGHTGAGNLPWEFHSQMRPSLQVFIAYLVSTAFRFLDPFHIVFILRMLSVALALTAVYYAGKASFKNGAALKLYYLFALFIWFMPYQHVRFSSENWCGFMMLFACMMVIKDRPMLYAGIFSGLSFCFRYQAAFFILGLFLWALFVKKAGIRQAAWFITGFVLITGLGICADYWMYDQWVLSSYKYFYINLVENKASYYGVEPFHYYLQKIIESGIAPIGLLLILSFGWHMVKQPVSIFTWTVLPFFLAHCLIGHKELRFLFPLASFVPFFMVTMSTGIAESGRFYKPVKAILILCVIINLLILPFASFKASNPRVTLFRHLYDQKEKPVCLKENPYRDIHWFSFYYPRHFDPVTMLTEHHADSVSPGKMMIIPHYTADSISGGTLIYRQIPSWTSKINYGKWLERSNFWCIIRKDSADTR